METFVGQGNHQIKAALVVRIQLECLGQLLDAQAELIVVDQTHPQQVVTFDGGTVQLDVLFQNLDRLGVIVVLVVLLCLLNQTVLLLPHCTDTTLMQARLNRRVVVLRQRRTRLPVKEVTRRVLLQ